MQDPNQQQQKPTPINAAVTITVPADGTTKSAPFLAEGTSSPSGQFAITGMAYQIDDGLPRAFTKKFGSANYDTWEFPVGEGDCGNPDTWYLLTVYAWAANGDLAWAHSRFKTT